MTSARAEGNGLKFGDARLHPFIEISPEFDSAAALGQSTTTGSYETKGDLLFHFRPGLKLEMPSPVFAVNLTGNAEYVLYTGA
ncbi:MAG: hypothetical protein HY901_33515, partial [Deltaproteobacteria bacterium]|nr:hypothetical protein [Deltaproteobacteria bacterium]